MEKKEKIIIVIPLILIILGGGVGLYFLVDKQSVQVKGGMPNPFKFNDGTMVDSEQNWLERRDEIKETLMDIEYGHIPDRPDALIATLIDSETRGDGSIYQNITLTVIPSNTSLSSNFNFTLDLYIPAGVGPFPAIVKVSYDGRGTQTPNNQTITQAGYIYACFHHTDLDPDEKNGDQDVIGPAQALYPEYDWGSLMVWAWGAMRVADYLLGEVWVTAEDGFPNVMGDALIVTGHSRRGKTALLAAAFDERFDMVDCNGGCAGGAASYLVLGPGAETLGSITSKSKFFYWFQEDFGEYADREDELGFDQHFLRSLVAPRVMLTTDGIGDSWANPLGVQAVYEASQPVFDFLGASEKNAIHFREGGHGFLEEDFDIILGLANKTLLGNDQIEGDFYMTPFDYDFPIYWEAPSI